MSANQIIYAHQYLDHSGTVTTASVDNVSLTHYDGSARHNPGLAVTHVDKKGWLRFHGNLPGGEYTAFLLLASWQSGGRRIQICLDSPTSPALWTLSCLSTPEPQILLPNISSHRHDVASGMHDIYLVFPDGFDGALNWLVPTQRWEHEPEDQMLRRMQWFDRARFGHMMHWGAYSVLGKGEWYMNTHQISKPDYIDLACKPFNPQHYDANAWADVIASAGQRYLTITTKHHDGYAIFDSNVIDFAPYDVVDTSDCHLSLLEPLAIACRERGIVFCTYYSLLDWSNPNAVAVDAAYAAAGEDPIAQAACATSIEAQRYMSQLREHLKEVIEIFDPALIWFDGGWAGFLDDTNSQSLRDFLRYLSPNIIVNNRIGYGHGDYTTPEQSIPAGTQSTHWESCMTMNNSWAYSFTDTHWKNSVTVLSNLLDCASKGGNYLLNTGPTPDGQIPQPCVDTLGEVGRWLGIWGDAVYGTRAGTLSVAAQPQAWCTTAMPDKTYISLLQWPDDAIVRVQKPHQTIIGAWLLNAPEQPLEWQISAGLVLIKVPAQMPDPLGAVVVLHTEGYPEPAQYPDKALFRTTTTNNVWFSDIAGHGPQLATDGDGKTRWATMSNVMPLWLEVDLGVDERVTQIGFVQNNPNIADFSISGWINGAWQVLLRGSVPPVDYIGYLAEPVYCSKVRLDISSATSESGPSLYSFSVIDADDSWLPLRSPANLALGAQTSASSVWYNKADYQTAHAVDGAANTRWASSDNVKSAWFELDLGRPQLMDVMRIDEYVDKSGPRITAFSIQVPDGDGWRDVYSGTDSTRAINFGRGLSTDKLRINITGLRDSSGPGFYGLGLYQTAQPPLPKLSDDALLDAEAHATFDFFWREANLTPGAPGYGLFAGDKGSRTASIADIGFGLSAIVIGVERGWVARDVASARVLATLYSVRDHVPHHGGFFYHFINMDTLVSTSEVSTVDTMLALNGILTAAQYFGGEIFDVAQQIYDRVEWDNYINPARNAFYMSWSPDTNFDDASSWGDYAEQFCMYPLAAGSTTHAPADTAAMFYALNRPVGSYKGSGDVVHTFGGVLFCYQFSHAWLDFRQVTDRKGVDWWTNSVRATLANRHFCVDISDLYPSLGPNDWGNTAVGTPNGYVVAGAPPSGRNNGNDQHDLDGTVTPSGAIGSMPFTPTESLAALRHFYEDHPYLWSNYGLVDAYNLSLPKPWYSSAVSGLIKGISLLMIENYRSGLLWRLWMAHPSVKRGLAVVFDPPAP